MTATLTLLDYVIVGFIILSMIIGLWRGFLREAISLLSWVAAFVVAFLFVEDAAAFLQPYVAIPTVRTILAFGGLFVATLVLGGLINLLVSQLVKVTGLSGTDRLLGVVFGLLRGIAVVAALLLAVSLTPLPETPWWQTSTLIPYFEPLVSWLRELLPPELLNFF